jgi:hypothetical protein
MANSLRALALAAALAMAMAMVAARTASAEAIPPAEALAAGAGPQHPVLVAEVVALMGWTIEMAARTSNDVGAALGIIPPRIRNRDTRIVPRFARLPAGGAIAGLPSFAGGRQAEPEDRFRAGTPRTTLGLARGVMAGIRRQAG